MTMQLDPLSVLVGFFGFFVWKFAVFVFWVMRVAAHDAWDLYKTGELKEGYSPMRWLLIVPIEFIRSAQETAIDEIRGYRRVL